MYCDLYSDDNNTDCYTYGTQYVANTVMNSQHDLM